MTSKVTSATVSEVKFASVTENINSLTLDDIKKGFAGCSGEGIPMTSANFNAVLNWITENIGLEADMVVETIKGKKYLITKAKDGSTAKIEIVKLIEKLRDSGVVTTDDFGNGFKFNEDTNKYDVALGKSLTFNKNGDIDIKSNPSGGVVINKDGLAELSLSKDNGNLLEMRKDGLFYGEIAPPNVANLYVDAVNGIDQDPVVVTNAGTRENPLRTIKYAFSLIPEGKVHTIYLREEQTHRIDAATPITASSLSASVRFYGDKLDAKYAGTPDNNIIVAKEFESENNLLPTVLFTGRREQEYNVTDMYRKFPNLNGIYLSPRSSLTFFGLNIHFDLGQDFVFEQINRGSSPSYSFVYPQFITAGDQSSLYFSRVALKVVGTPRVSGNKAGFEVQDLKQQDSQGLWRAAAVYGSNFKFEVRLQRDLDSFPMYLFGVTGWLSPYGSNVSISHVGASENMQREIAKRIYNPTLDPVGDTKLVLAPITNIPGKYFP